MHLFVVLLSAYMLLQVLTYIVSEYFAWLVLRMQAMAIEQNEKIEIVNRERKYHQVNLLTR